MKRIVLVAALSALLSACGGGSSGNANVASVATTATMAVTQPFECVSLRSVAGVYRSTAIDLRRDDPGFTAEGHGLASFETTKLMLHRAQCVGFDTVIFHTNIPIDAATGLIKAGQEIPRDFWKSAAYAKSIGLKVGVKPIPVDWSNDNPLNSDTHGLPVRTALDSIKQFEIVLARESQKVAVDIFYVGSFQYGIDNAEYQTEWADIVDSVRSVFTGKLAYANCWQCTDNVVWSMVDIVASSWNLSSFTVDNVEQLARTYNKPVIADWAQIMAVPPGFREEQLWTNVVSGVPITVAADYNEQQRKLGDFFTTIGYQPENLAGFVLNEYMPWMQNSNIQNPITNIEYQFKLFDIIGNSLYNNIQAQTTIQYYLKKLWS